MTRTAFVILAALAAAAPAGAAPQLLVFAASSTTNAMTDIGEAFAAATGTEVTFSFDSSSRAARQIAAGAPADVFVSANRAWTAWLIACGPGVADTRRAIAGNRLVVAAPAAASIPGRNEFGPGLPALAAERFAIADPDGVPAGIYAREALQAIGVWPAVAERALRGDSVRTVLVWLETGAAQAGIVYASDAMESDRVRIVANIPATLHRPIVYEAVATLHAHPDAVAFVDFLTSDAGRTAFAHHGFTPPPEGASSVSTAAITCGP